MSLARTAGVTGDWSNSRSSNRQRMVRAGRHEHDVDQARPGDQPHLLAIFLERLEPDLAGVHLGRPAGRTEPERHVGVLGVGDDELAAARVGVDRGELAVERFLHGVSASLALSGDGDPGTRRRAVAARRAHRDPHRVASGGAVRRGFGPAARTARRAWPCRRPWDCS